MNNSVLTNVRGVASLIMLTLSFMLLFPVQSVAQQRATSPRSRARSSSAPLPSVAPLPANTDPFAAIESEADAGHALNLTFTRTKLDGIADATAQVVLRDNTLLVRMRAKNVPQPSRFGVPRYALWAYIPNYKVKFYIGDLPVTSSSPAGRGDSDSAYRYVGLPRDAVFGGLMLTAEPIRYTPIVTEALRPLLVALAPEANLTNAAAATTVYAGPPPSFTVTVPATPNNNAANSSRSRGVERRRSTRKRSRTTNRRRDTAPRRSSRD
ncbi:MAG: hypothetical protein H0V88_11190 [Pyrinomonadaceae bacterium]|nr:hypothetical protein [Pyrinomonadaceae bacterium]